jgi:hypothetical protein
MAPGFWSFRIKRKQNWPGIFCFLCRYGSDGVMERMLRAEACCLPHAECLLPGLLIFRARSVLNIIFRKDWVEWSNQ